MRIKVIACKVLLRELYTLAAKSANIIDIRWMKEELHTEPKSLKNQIQRAIDEIEEDPEGYDAICIGYGLCSNGIIGLKTKHMKLIIPRAHDCITLLLGAAKTYKRMFENGSGGIYWYSKGWMELGVTYGASRNEEKYREYVEKYGEDNADYLMEIESGWLNEYREAAFIQWPEIDSAECENKAREIAQEKQWDFRVVEGKNRLLRHMLEGDWNPEEFLVLEPGETVKASYDDGIIKA